MADLAALNAADLSAGFAAREFSPVEVTKALLARIEKLDARSNAFCLVDAPATLAQYSKDVTAFLMWAAEPKLVQRKRTGFQVMIFLIVLSGLLYFTKKKVWSAVH